MQAETTTIFFFRQISLYPAASIIRAQTSVGHSVIAGVNSHVCSLLFGRHQVAVMHLLGI